MVVHAAAGEPGGTSMPRRCRLADVFAFLAAMAVLAACEQGNQYVPPPLPKVAVAKPAKQPITRYLDATGSTAAVNSADLVARVPGFIETINYDDGAAVKKGALLFTIELEPYRVKLEQAKAAEESAQSAFNQQQAAYERSAELIKQKVTTQALYDQALANRDAAQATLDNARSNTRLAAINYDYAQVKAPFDGVVSARTVSVGSYVGGSATPTVLATIVQLDPIYVNFNVSEQDVIRVRAALAKRGVTRDDLMKYRVEVALQDETDYPHVGHIDYIAPTLNPQTGTLAVRGVLQNPKHVLLSGYFVRVRVPNPTKEVSLLVPDVALGSDQGGRYVLVLNDDNVVEQRKVEIGPLVGSMRVIDKGLTENDRVVVSGLLRAIPGQKVDPQAAPAKTAAR
ncbi:MAG: efflux RND transporter periplasmic adaptor subunit [Rhizobiales bacterium]|nr:efflux RND transporter periplasmic adaptor subunit [Hyphomicrobiales bacterium]